MACGRRCPAPAIAPPEPTLMATVNRTWPSNTGQGVSILLGTGSAKAPFTAGQSLTLSNAGCLLAADLNGDHIPDLVVPQPDAVDAYLNNGNGTFTLKSSTPGSTGTGAVTLADFNRDGKLDFATTGNSLALGNGDGTFQTPVPLTTNPPPYRFTDIGAGDLNNDGWPDLVLTSGAELGAAIYILLNDRSEERRVGKEGRSRWVP